MEKTTKALTPEERDAALVHIRRNKGLPMLDGFAFGQRVEYRGMLYFIYDWDANDDVPEESTPVLIDHDFRIVRGVLWSDISKA
jgi:hypothetical protein